ncbi:class I SAM-dependent methyltransferase [Synechococcus sp. UW140]|uniref:class I SAM-dependent methyltransferase n=1 Tax=Synechococcus sp. UW140 TaxID=368503 RepID=UPI0031383739
MFFKKFIDLLTSFTSNLFGEKFPPDKFKYSEEKRKLDLIGNNSDIFNYYYNNNFWGDSESVSGPGSTLAYTENLRAELPKLVEELEVTSILDSPCGDYNWFRMIEWNGEITYVGGDIVESLVSRNQLLYGSEKRNFVCLDIINDKLPDADIWLCRDCLFHLSNTDIAIVLKNFLRSNIKYLLTSTYPRSKKSIDIPSGSFRLLNLEISPFNLGKPLKVIDDFIDGFPERQLGLWERHKIIEALAKNKDFQALLTRDN